ncbi:hypothetical protein SRHO_G00320270 [Serrasalmus rhombeus]
MTGDGLNISSHIIKIRSHKNRNLNNALNIQNPRRSGLSSSAGLSTLTEPGETLPRWRFKSTRGGRKRRRRRRRTVEGGREMEKSEGLDDFHPLLFGLSQQLGDRAWPGAARSCLFLSSFSSPAMRA